MFVDHKNITTYISDIHETAKAFMLDKKLIGWIFAHWGVSKQKKLIKSHPPFAVCQSKTPFLRLAIWNITLSKLLNFSSVKPEDPL